MSTARRVFCSLTALALGLASVGPAPAGGIPATTLKEIKAATVFVKVSLTGPGIGRPLPASGSGFVMMVDGETAYIATNEHVVSVPKDFPRLKLAGPPTLVFHSGTPKEFTVNADILATDSSRDLAILRIKNVKDLPKAIPLDPKLELTETMTVFTFGFPFGQALSTTMGNPGMTVGKGSVSSIRLDEFGKVKVVQIDGELNPGNSGGPVVDEKGSLVGIAVAKIDGTRIGMAIPPPELTAMLLGRVGGISMTPIKMDKEHVDIFANASLIDPMRKLKSVSILYLPAPELKEIPKISKEGRFPAITGATKLDLKIDRDKDVASALFSFTPKEPGKVKLAYQTVYTKADGDTVYTAVLFTEVDTSGTIITGSLAADDPIDKVTKQPSKTHVQALKSGKTYIIDMMGDPKEIDPLLRLADSSGAQVAMDDDGGIGLNARIVYTPNKDDNFSIIATTLRGTGAYTLRITEELPLQVGKGIVITSSLTASDPIIRTPRVISHYKIFKVELVKGKTYTIECQSTEIQPYVNLSGN